MLSSHAGHVGWPGARELSVKVAVLTLRSAAHRCTASPSPDLCKHHNHQLCRPDGLCLNLPGSQMGQVQPRGCPGHGARPSSSTGPAAPQRKWEPGALLLMRKGTAGWRHTSLSSSFSSSCLPPSTLSALHLQSRSGLTFCISGNPNQDTPSAEMFMQLTTISPNHLLLLVMLPWSGASPFT